MAYYFQGLKPKPIPDVSSLIGADAYAVAYNEKYAEIARSLVETVATLKKVSERHGIKSKDIGTLAGLALEFRPDYRKDTVKLVLAPDTRFYPAALESEGFYEHLFQLSATQIRSLVDDLKRVGGSLEGIATTSMKSPGVSVMHIVSAHNFCPSESLNLSLQEDGTIYRVGRVYRVSFPNVQVGDYDAINKTLAEFDQTESGKHIPLGRNRLALLFAAQHFLVGEIERQQARREETLRELDELDNPEQKSTPNS